jgi:hypothetical protein
MLSRTRPLPSIEMRTPAFCRRDVQAQAVNRRTALKAANWLPWSVFMMSGGP